MVLLLLHSLALPSWSISSWYSCLGQPWYGLRGATVVPWGIYMPPSHMDGASWWHIRRGMAGWDSCGDTCIWARRMDHSKVRVS